MALTVSTASAQKMSIGWSGDTAVVTVDRPTKYLILPVEENTGEKKVLFDTGNAVMMTGGSYAMTSTLLHTGGETRESAKDILLKFLKSVPFDTYMVMILLAALNVPMPHALFELTRPAGQANAFVAMLMIGMMFEPAGDKALLKETARELLWRYAFALVFALVIYFATPFELVVRQTLAVICFAPLSSLAPIYTDRCRSDTALASFTNSVSIAVSLVAMLALSMIFVA